MEEGGGTLTLSPLNKNCSSSNKTSSYNKKKIIRYSTRKCGSNIYYIEY